MTQRNATQRALDAPTSDNTPAAKSPFPNTASLVVRSIRRGWNTAQGCEQWELLQQSKTNQTRDKRIVVVDESGTLLQTIFIADPRARDLMRNGPVRDLYPTYKVQVKQRGTYCYVEKWDALPLQKTEIAHREDRVHFDSLDDLRKELGLGRAETDQIYRDCLPNNDWWVLAEQRIREKHAANQAAKHPAPVPVLDTPTGSQDRENLDEWFPREQETTVSELHDELTSVAETQAAQDAPFEHELDPEKAVFAIPNHLTKTFGKAKAGLHVRNIFGMALNEWLAKHDNDTRQAWGLVLDYEAKNGENENSPKSGDISQPSQTNTDNTKPTNSVPQNPSNRGIQQSEGKVPTNIIKLDESQIRQKYTKKLQGGKEYLEVAGRVLLFRLDHPAESGWTIDTELVHADEHGCIFKARVSNADGHVVATGHARAIEAKSANFGGRIFEKAETAAIGRALAHAGYGTDDVEETDESESPAHLADSPRKAS